MDSEFGVLQNTPAGYLLFYETKRKLELKHNSTDDWGRVIFGK